MTDTGDPQDVAESLDADVLSDDDDDPTGLLEYPPERPMGVGQYGETVSEERVDEPLAERVAREVPDPLDEISEPDEELLAEIEIEIEIEAERDGVGRLVEPGADDDAVYRTDDEADAIAYSVDEGDLSAEEAAVHLVLESPYGDLDDEDGQPG